MNTDYTLILNYYNKTEELLRSQIKRCMQQTLPPKYVIGCFLGLPEEKAKFMQIWLELAGTLDNVYTVYSDLNFKHIGRYQVALSAPTEKIITLDDDRFPRPDYCKGIVSVLHHDDCLVQNYGWKLKRTENYVGNGYDKEDAVFKGLADMSGKYYNLKADRSKDGPSLKKVDYLCGGMGFRKSSLKYLFAEDIYDDVRLIGDDIAFCLRANKNGVPVYCYRPQDSHSGDSRSLEHNSAGINPTATSQNFWEIRSRMLHREMGYPWGKDFEKKRKDFN